MIWNKNKIRLNKFRDKELATESNRVRGEREQKNATRRLIYEYI